ncbi:hypothetical protein [Coralloluteibacterium stylophorae]|uniref:Uncharacterized protein n=1 Tax=Coralloluteibacterium stylophorae TaxID=1776034 RepID=A0A8J7VQH3_9GAMM|nr:hypothetical protein [Coralloluteibacterium stylophorae]MBS7456895.1 hypothetical protein [Coralloluteibacterium stylophorae]
MARVLYFVLTVPAAAALAICAAQLTAAGGSAFEGARGYGVLLSIPPFFVVAWAVLCIAYLGVRRSARGLTIANVVMAAAAPLLLLAFTAAGVL